MREIVRRHRMTNIMGKLAKLSGNCAHAWIGLGPRLSISVERMREIKNDFLRSDVTE